MIMPSPRRPFSAPIFDKQGKLLPDDDDYLAVEQEYGALPAHATDKQFAERYRLAQANKLIRLYERGKLPLEVMRALDQLRKRKPGK
jgi:hypothetical protein